MTSTASPASARLTSNNQPRRVLGDVSPNVRPAAPAGTPGGKMLTGSPLKRSFTAAMEGGQGFRYLKKRKFSIDSPLSQMMTAEEAAVQDGPTKVEQSQAPLVGLVSQSGFQPPLLYAYAMQRMICPLYNNSIPRGQTRLRARPTETKMSTSPQPTADLSPP